MDTQHDRLPVTSAVLAWDIDKVGMTASLEALRMRPKDHEPSADGVMTDTNEMPF